MRGTPTRHELMTKKVPRRKSCSSTLGSWLIDVYLLATVLIVLGWMQSDLAEAAGTADGRGPVDACGTGDAHRAGGGSPLATNRDIRSVIGRIGTDSKRFHRATSIDSFAVTPLKPEMIAPMPLQIAMSPTVPRPASISPAQAVPGHLQFRLRGRRASSSLSRSELL